MVYSSWKAQLNLSLHGQMSYFCRCFSVIFHVPQLSFNNPCIIIPFQDNCSLGVQKSLTVVNYHLNLNQVNRFKSVSTDLKIDEQWLTSIRWVSSNNRVPKEQSSIIKRMTHILLLFFLQQDHPHIALVFAKNSKTALLFQKIAEIPYFFWLSGTPPLGVAGYPKKWQNFVLIIPRNLDLRGIFLFFFRKF